MNRSSPRMGRGRRALDLLGAALALTAAVGLLLLGGAWPGARPILHLGTAVALLVAAMLPDRDLAAAGHLPRWSAGIGILAGAVALGLVPLPRPILAAVAPAVAADWPDAGWRVASHDPEGTVGSLAMFAVVGGFGAAVVAWGAAGGRRWEVQRAQIALAALLVGVAGLHLALGLQSLFGVIPTRLGQERAFFAPFVSRNHFGATLLLLAPTVIGDALAHRRGTGAIPRGVLAVALLTLLLLTHSPGIAIAGLATVALAAVRPFGWRALAVGVPAAALVAIAAPLWLWIAEPWLEQALFPRARMWADALVLVGWSPALGIGAGAFGEAIERVRSDCVARVWVHAHDLPLEWWLETGFAGLIAAAAAGWLLRPGPARDDGDRARRVLLGLFALAIHNLVDFSLLLPGVAVLAGGCLAARIGVFGEKAAVRPLAARALLVGFGLAQLPAAGFTLTQALADRAEDELVRSVGSPRDAAEAAARVGRWAPWRHEAVLAEAWSAEAGGDPAGALATARAATGRFPTDGDAQRRLAHLFWRHGACPEALATAARARELQPASWRNAVLDARIAKRCRQTERMVDAWTRALTCQAPQRTMFEAYGDFPIGVVWVDRLAAHPDRLRRLAVVADPETAALAWDVASARKGYGEALEHVEALIAAGRIDDARARLERVRAAHPSHPRLPAVTARLAAGAGAEAPDVPIGPVARAVRAVEAASGVPAAIAEAERQALLGNARDPGLVYEQARLALRAGNPVKCVSILTTAGLSGHPVVGDQARALLRNCEAARQ